MKLVVLKWRGERQWEHIYLAKHGSRGTKNSFSSPNSSKQSQVVEPHADEFSQLAAVIAPRVDLCTAVTLVTVHAPVRLARRKRNNEVLLKVSVMALARLPVNRSIPQRPCQETPQSRQALLEQSTFHNPSAHILPPLHPTTASPNACQSTLCQSPNGCGTLFIPFDCFGRTQTNWKQRHWPVAMGSININKEVTEGAGDKSRFLQALVELLECQQLLTDDGAHRHRVEGSPSTWQKERHRLH